MSAFLFGALILYDAIDDFKLDDSDDGVMGQQSTDEGMIECVFDILGPGTCADVNQNNVLDLLSSIWSSLCRLACQRLQERLLLPTIALRSCTQRNTSDIRRHVERLWCFGAGFEIQNDMVRTAGVVFG